MYQKNHFKGIAFLFALLVVLFCTAPTMYSIPGLISYQGRLTDTNGKPITLQVDVTFTFWDAEAGGNQLGSFSDTDTITPSAEGLFTTMIGDDPGNLIPETIFSSSNVWLDINVGGVHLTPRTRILSVGYAVKSSKAATASMADIATTASTSLALAGALNKPGDKIALGNNVWLVVAADGSAEISANGQRYRLGSLHWGNPWGLHDNISPDGQNSTYPQVVMDNSSNAMIVWQQIDGAKFQIFKSECHFSF